jgi:hypothetical protein
MEELILSARNHRPRTDIFSRMDQTEDTQTSWPRLSPRVIAEELEAERQTIENDGIQELAFLSSEPPTPPSAPTFDKDLYPMVDIEYILVVRAAPVAADSLSPYAGIDRSQLKGNRGTTHVDQILKAIEQADDTMSRALDENDYFLWRDDPSRFKDGYLRLVLTNLEANARSTYERAAREYELQARYWPEQAEKRDRLLTVAKDLRENVPPAITRLRPAYEPDPDGAHRPIYMGYLGINATACLDCAWFEWTSKELLDVSGSSPIARHRALHWDPPHAVLCDMSSVVGSENSPNSVYFHLASENIGPRHFPETPDESFGPLVYPPLAIGIKYQFFDEHSEDSRSYSLCESCNSKTVQKSGHPSDWEFDN